MERQSDQTLQILKELSEAHGVSGYEDDVRELVRRRLAKLPCDFKTDALGNLFAYFPAPSPDAPVLMLDAHLDEIGLVISYVEPNGFLRFTTVGGWDERVLPAHAVDVKTESGDIFRGVIGTPPPHISKPEERNKPFALENLFIDVGAGSSDEVAEMGIRVGDSAVPSYPFTELTNGRVIGKALDDRAGCTVLIRTLEELFGAGVPDLPMQVVAVFSTFEEVGARGAQVASFEVAPDLAIVLEGTVAADGPGVPAARCPSRHGGGPVLTLIDRTAQLPRRLVRFIEDIGRENGIPTQLKTPSYGGTNAARIQMVRSGVPVSVISVPCRYIHSPHSILRLDDLEHTIQLTTALVRQAYNYLSSSDFSR